ncbi:bap31 domain protein [Terfezia boudieri ATCC MYA-4762]|uniref:Endoplasmic reticulum transmembrane protein n=1 Tax=Terfezia boudieri ATCC MYA-4762 TaxID=1051890 RepID=A0A3N4LFE8_9PEZI|nr:bap31 domain protein [Terfezia boudieri ATCC MYA-4762]
MTLYYSLVFVLLLSEMGIFMLLILPLPFTWRKKLFQFISESALVAKLQYGMKITFIFILILFVDSVNRVYRVTQELHNAPRGTSTVTMGPERMEVQARKFYSQRNMYLCGFTLFLSLILNRTYALILDVLRLEEAVANLRKENNKNAASGNAVTEVSRLKKELEKKDMEMEVLKKQAEGLAREYGELSDLYKVVEGRKGEVRKDL